MNNTEDEMLPAELRAIAAMLAMQGLLAGGTLLRDPEHVADRAVVLADLLIKRLAQ